MTLRVAIQMDEITSININSDSTFLLGIEATQRKYEVFYYTADKLTYCDGVIYARAHPIKFFAKPECRYELGESIILNLRDIDVVLLRQDPPFNMTYITTTYLLEQLSSKTLVVNDPASVRNHSEKIFPTLLNEFMPPTLISADVQEIKEFYAQHKDIILKPLYGYGGRAILHLKEADDNFNALTEMLFSTSKEPIIAQRFLPEVKSEDKRIILVDGEVVGAFGRIPLAGDIRANMRVGGKVIKVELSKKQQEICEALRQPLKDKGLIFVGLDVIGEWLTEINITSPTGLRAVNNLRGVNLEKNIWDVIEDKIISCQKQ
jgi:glutathione synthase